MSPVGAPSEGWQGGLVLGALGRLGEAEAAFDAAARQHPDFADAWNNLAQVQQEQGSLRQAEQSVAKAVALGGPRLERYLALQAKIKAALQS